MLRFGSRGERASSSPAFEAAPLNLGDPAFAELAASLDPAFGGATRARADRGHRVRDIYLSDPELQRIYPLGLLPLGQRHFLTWLTTHGRTDQQLTDAEIALFLRETADDQLTGWRLTYLLQPTWQEAFPSL